jgi:hypothetical protein
MYFRRIDRFLLPWKTLAASCLTEIAAAFGR